METIAAARRPRGAVLAGLLSALILTASLFQTAQRTEPRPETWAERVPSKHLKNWYKLNDNVYRSGQPGRKGFEEIRGYGIKTVINLRAHHSDAKLAAGLGLVLIDVPMTAGGFSEADIVAALAAIGNAAKPVLLHCRRGADRAGVVSAMYRIVCQNWSKEDALAELRGGGFGFDPRYTNILRFIREADIAKLKTQLGLV